MDYFPSAQLSCSRLKGWAAALSPFQRHAVHHEVLQAIGQEIWLSIAGMLRLRSMVAEVRLAFKDRPKYTLLELLDKLDMAHLKDSKFLPPRLQRALQCYAYVFEDGMSSRLRAPCVALWVCGGQPGPRVPLQANTEAISSSAAMTLARTLWGRSAPPCVVIPVAADLLQP